MVDSPQTLIRRGLTLDECKLATALLYGRYRSHLGNLSVRTDPDRGRYMEVWDRSMAKQPELRIERWGDQLVALQGTGEIRTSSASVIGLMARVFADGQAALSI